MTKQKIEAKFNKNMDRIEKVMKALNDKLIEYDEEFELSGHADWSLVGDLGHVATVLEDQLGSFLGTEK